MPKQVLTLLPLDCGAAARFPILVNLQIYLSHKASVLLPPQTSEAFVIAVKDLSRVAAKSVKRKQ